MEVMDAIVATQVGNPMRGRTSFLFEACKFLSFRNMHMSRPEHSLLRINPLKCVGIAMLSFT